MLNIRNYSISKKLTCMNMLVSGMALLSACAAFVAYDLSTYQIVIARNLSTEASIVGSNSVAALVFSDPRAAENTLSALNASPHIQYAAIYTQDGQPFAGYWRDGSRKTLPLPNIPPGKIQSHWLVDGQMALVQSIIFQGKSTGFVYIRSDLQAMNDRLKTYALIAATVMLISLVLALMISRISQRVVSEPVMELAQTVRIVSHEKNYSIRAATSKNRDVERATKLKSKFLASMSHELRTPLNAIVGFSDLLAEQTAGELNDKQKRFVNHIKQGSAHLLQLINDILDLSKIEAGQLEIRSERFQISEALPEVLSTIRPLAMAKQITVQHPPEADLPVYADRVRFKQILYNLLSNAVKFTPKGGRIEIDCFESAGQIGLSVTDTGIGIRPEDQKVVFEEFRQVEGKQGAVNE